jgi:DNA-binding transcriptional MerR regulator
MSTIGRLARRHGLSRSTLLYYHRLGLLTPSARAENGYRVYTEADSRRLDLITLYRKAGLSLKAIGEVLEPKARSLDRALNGRLSELDHEIDRLRGQQRLVLALLKREPPDDLAVMDRRAWTGLLAASGFSEDDMHAWHGAFERSAPKKHQAFLAFLGIPADEIANIRAWSRRRGARPKSP